MERAFLPSAFCLLPSRSGGRTAPRLNEVRQRGHGLERLERLLAVGNLDPVLLFDVEGKFQRVDAVQSQAGP